MNRAIRVAAAIAVLAVLAGLSGAGCQRSAPAAVRDLRLLEQALTNPEAYPAAVAELATRPKAALAAIAEQSAAAGTRREFFLRMIAYHVEHASEYERESGKVFFWSERLLVGPPAAGELAAQRLAKMSDATARQALGLRILDVTRDPDPGFRVVAAHFGASGDVAPLLAALAAWFASEAIMKNDALDALRAGVRLLPAKNHTAIEKRLLSALEKESLTRAERQARLLVLAHIVSPGSLERVAALRKSAWGTALRAEIDPVLAAAIAQSSRNALFGRQAAAVSP